MFNFFRKNYPSATGEKLNLKLSGLHCTACAVNIDLTLEDLTGVTNSKTNYARSTTAVDFDPEKIDTQKIITEISKLGYEVESL